MPNDKRPLKAFLCHASADKPAVRELYKRLISDGVDAWLDVESLLPGQKWKEEIPKAIRSADIVLVCLSESSINKEGFVQKEIKEALDIADEKPEGTIYIIPARLEECDVPTRLAEYHWVNLYNQDGYDKLLLSFKARAKSVAATLLPDKLSQIEEVKSKAVQLELQGSLPESLKAYNQLRLLEPAYSGIDKKIQELQNKSKSRKLSPQIILSATVIIIVGLLSSSLIEKWLSPVPLATEKATVAFTLTSQPSIPSQTLASTFVVATPSITITPTENFILTTTPLPTEITDAKGVSMVLVPAGEFTMGSNNGGHDDRLVHQLYLKEFYIDKYEVTNAQYQECVKLGACAPLSNTYYSKTEYINHPVTFINWNMAKSYCSWREARLPTEAEWEKAARGSKDVYYPWGNVIDCSYANYRGLNGHCVGDSKPVGSYPSGKSIYGVYDMAGNAMEWVSSALGNYPYNANDGRERLDTSDPRIIRGGSWNSLESAVRVSTRAWNLPSSAEFDFGFRCAQDGTQ